MDQRASTAFGSSDLAFSVELVRRADFELGSATIRPSIRTVEGPGGTATAEPRVMQVLLALADAGGAVLSREDLIELCWQSRIVGDDAVNRTIAAVRRIALETQAGFVVETIPRIGYRLTGIAPARPAAPLDIAQEAGTSAAATEGATRRGIMIGAASLAGLAGIGGWLFLGSRAQAEYRTQVDRARAMLHEEDAPAAAGVLRGLVASDPDRAEAWGLLAYANFQLALAAPPGRADSDVAGSKEAAERALSIDPESADALLAMAMLQSKQGDWLSTERRLRRIAELSPRHVEAIEYLALLLQSVGRCNESRDWADRAFSLEPLKRSLVYKQAMKHWIFGDVRQADQAIDKALLLWPAHPWVWQTRLMIYAFTGRPRAALSMLDDARNRPAAMTPAISQVWREGLIALDTRAAGDISKARKNILSSAVQSPASAGLGVMLLSALGELDAAFAVAEGLLLKRGRYVGGLQVNNDNSAIDNQSWRRTQWVFTPAVAPFRADVRFRDICDGVGLTDYWRSSGAWPDAFVRGSIAGLVS